MSLGLRGPNLRQPNLTARPISRPIVEVRNLSRTFRNGGLERIALRDVSFDLLQGRTLAVVGESGAGKSTLARLVAGLDRPTHGSVLIAGEPLRLRSGTPSPVQMVFQDPQDALDPHWSVGRSVAEPLRRWTNPQRRERVFELLNLVGLDPTRADQRPAAFSGGQQQRFVIARALAAVPKVLICDEATSAVDVSVQAQIVNLLMDLQASTGFACLLVTHDLSVARVLAHEVMVLRQGVVIEQTEAREFFEMPRAEYSRSLLEAVRQQSLFQG